MTIMSVSLSAIYHPVATDQQVQQQDTLIYNQKDGFTWVRLADGDSCWWTFAKSAPTAERLAREAGFNPRAIYYINESGKVRDED